MLSKGPELAEIHRNVCCRCILDGELAAKSAPACFTAFDILYYRDHSVNLLPLTERKKLLDDVVASESAQFAKSRYIEKNGISFYHLAAGDTSRLALAVRVSDGSRRCLG